ncbi:MAG: tetratricopeptide repeat-containing sulfotransferase family protein [Gammaproteobacteria bacterium]
MMLKDAIVDIDLGDGAGKRKVPFADVHRVIGELLQGSQFGQAAAISVQLAEQRPRDLWPQLVAGESLYLHQQIEPAIRYVDRALAIDPRNVASLVVRARLCVFTGDADEAVTLLDAAAAIAPNDARLQNVRAEVLVDAGDIDRARTSYLRAIELNPRNVDGFLGLTTLPGAPGDELITAFESVAQSHELSADDQIKAHFALAQAYESTGVPAEQFAHLQAGNGLKNASLSYSGAAASREAQQIIDCFSLDYFSQDSGADRKVPEQRSDPVIFIVGFPRCGSTLVEQILSCHPDVSAAGETFALRHAVASFQQANVPSVPYPAWIDLPQAGSLAGIADDYLRRVSEFNQTAYLTDKLLDNYRFVGLIHLIFPHARIVDVRRNPIDTCFSCYKRLFNLGSVPFAYDLDNLASKYRDYRRLIRHWHSVLPGKIHTVEYEQLVSRQEDTTRALLKYCGLSWDDACMDFYRNARPVMTNSNVQVRQPLYGDSIGRWEALAEYLGPLLELDND